MLVKTREELQNQNSLLRFGVIIFIIGILIITGFSTFQIKKLKQSKLIYHEDLYESLERMQENCGSTYITTRSNEPGLFVFSETCRGDYCKFDYIPIEECLKNVRVT